MSEPTKVHMHCCCSFCYGKPGQGRPMAGQFASIDQVANGGHTHSTPGETLAMAETVRALLFEESSVTIGELQVVGRPVTLRPGAALVFTTTDVEGVEFEHFIQQRID